MPGVQAWCVMVQREVADRLFATPSTKAYGAVSVLMQLVTERTGFHPVSREVFRPRPNVESALVAFERVAPGIPAGVKPVVEGAFAHRRKTLANSLALTGIATREQAAAALEAIGRDPAARAEALAPPEFVALAHAPAVTRRRRAGEDQPRARRRRRGTTTVCTRSHACSSASTSPTRSRSSRPSALVVEGFADDTIVTRALAGIAAAAGVEAALARPHREADPGRRRTRRRELGRRHGAPPRQRHAARAAPAGATPCRRPQPRRRRPVLPRPRPEARHRRRLDPRAGRAPAGLRRRAPAASTAP